MTVFKGVLYNIMPIENIPSVMQHGILSYNKREKKNIEGISIASKTVQQLRDIKVVQGFSLHEYANLYFDARNPMMYKLKSNNLQNTLCVLIINKSILEIEDVVLTDRNAAANDKWIRYHSPDNIDSLNFKKIYARYWINQEHISGCTCGECHVNKSMKSAEVLIPNCVPFSYITGALVVNEKSKQALEQQNFPREITIQPNMFFC